MNRFFNEIGYDKNFSTFDEHIDYLKDKIKEEEIWIDEGKASIKNYKKEIEEIVAAKTAMENNPLTHEPAVWLDGWKDTDDKKQEVYEWCQAHELRYHPEIVGNYCKEEARVSEKHKPNYEFITASSDTSKIRYVRCVDCYKNWVRAGKPDFYERYLKN